MNVVLIAHDVKKELMINFCIAYKDILKKHNLFATEMTGSMIAGASGLYISFFSYGTVGEQQITMRLLYNEIDMVIFFRDPQMAQENYEDFQTIMQLCDTNNIPIATNIGSAEMLLKSLDRGELDWRLKIK